MLRFLLFMLQILLIKINGNITVWGHNTISSDVQLEQYNTRKRTKIKNISGFVGPRMSVGDVTAGEKTSVVRRSR